MKLSILMGAAATAALLTAGSALAQSTPSQGSATASSSIDQTGNSNNAYVDQINGAQGASVVIQGYPDAVTAGGVAGSFNIANVTQDGTTGARATTIQGNMSKPTIATRPATPAIPANPHGTPPTQTVPAQPALSGPTNTGVAYDTARLAGLDTTSSSNVNGTTINSAAATLADATQMGNLSTINQSGKSPDALNYQYGNGNQATINQSGAAGGSALGLTGVNGVNSRANAINFAFNADYIDAHGAAAGGLGGAAIVQDHALADTAQVDQVNSSNGARIVQFFAVQSNAQLTQNGTGGSAVVAQRYGNDLHSTITQSATSSSGVASVDQTGAHNTGNITQLGANDDAQTYQSGLSDFSTTTQAGGHQVAVTYETGSSDVSLIDQSGGGANVSLGNLAKVAQTSSNDWSSITQAGQSNTAVVNQTVAGLHFSH